MIETAYRRSHAIGRLAMVLLIVAAGCSTTSPRVQSNPGNKMTKQAKALRDQAPVPQALPTELLLQLPGEYVIGIGDTLRAEMVDIDTLVQLPSDQPVQLDGKVDLGTYGRVLVAGMTLAQAEKEVHARIKSITKDAGEVRLRLLTSDSKTYFVLGEVNAPGEFPIIGRESVLSAIVRAGGLTSSADVTQILVSRPTKPCDCRKVMPVCYQNIVQIGDTSTNYQLQPGDRVFIPRKPWWHDIAQFFGRKKRCDPCDLPQSGCPDPGLNCMPQNCVPQETPIPAAAIPSPQ